MFKVIIGLISGILFGIGMITSNMVDPAKVIGFLNISGNWDPSLAFVMGGALAVFIPCYHLLIKKRSHAINGEKFSYTTNTEIDAKLISGAAIFGAGWGLAGFCPGPAMASLSGGSFTIIVFMLSMVTGIVLARQYLQGKLPLPFVAARKKACKV